MLGKESEQKDRDGVQKEGMGISESIRIGSKGSEGKRWRVKGKREKGSEKEVDR